jgi:transposase
MYIWQNELLSYIVSSEHRDYDTIGTQFPQGLPKSTLVSDCLAAQLKTPAMRHQICAQSHLMRELANFETALKSEWSVQFKHVLEQAFALKKRMTNQTEGSSDYEKPPPKIIDIERQVTELLSIDYSTFHTKLQAFIKRLLKHRDSILTFLYHAEVPADNNGSERGIRNIKVKTKVSGQFRNTAGAERFAKIRSVVDTAIKNGQPVFNALSTLARY